MLLPFLWYPTVLALVARHLAIIEWSRSYITPAYEAEHEERESLARDMKAIR
jgi:hypothetical protein